jgi:hypothetical protein
LIAVLALAEIPIMLALRESICPSMPFWVEVQQCLLDLF